MYTRPNEEKMLELEKRIEDFFSARDIKYGFDTDITEICNALGIEVLSLDLPEEMGDEIAGVLLVQKDGKFIGINSSLKVDDARFVIAHELSHYISQEGHLEYAFKDKLYHGNEKSQTEHEMDYMAASILVPRKQFKSYLNLLGINAIHTLDEAKNIDPMIVALLRRKFHVNPDLIYRRIMEVS